MAECVITPHRYKGAEYCDQPVCLCVSVREHISGTAGSIDTKFYVRIPWPWLGPPPAALRYVMYFRFYGMDDVTFGRNGRDARKGCQHLA